MPKILDYSIRHQLHVDLIDAYKKVAPFCWSQKEAHERMVKEPAPRYYVTARQACQVISPMVKGNFETVNLMLPTRRRMYYSLFDEVVKLMDKPAFYNKSLYQIVQAAVLRPAPEFFLSPSRAWHIRYWLKSGVIDEEGKVDESRLPSYARTREYHRKKRERRKWIAAQKLQEGMEAESSQSSPIPSKG